MKTATKISVFLNNFFSLAIFLGLFLIASFSLVSLSPIAFEDYSAYQSYFDKESKGNIPQVAGANDVNDKKTFENLLVGHGAYYSFSSAENDARLYVLNQGEIEISDKLSLIKVNNSEYHKKTYQVNFDFSNKSVRTGLVASVGSITAINENLYEFDIEPGQEVVLELLVSNINTNDRITSVDNFELNLQINSVETSKNFQELDGNLVDQLP
jgi:hypothetical protein